MRKIKTIKMNDRELTIRELRVKDVVEIFSNADKIELSDIPGTIDKLLPRCCDFTWDDLYELGGSEIEEIYGAFKEVNAVFFEVAGTMGLGGIIEGLKTSIRKEFSAALAGSFKPDTPAP